MPRGDATRGAGLSTYYEPRLLSSRFFFSPRVSPPDAVRRCLSPFRPLCIPSPLVFPPSLSRPPTESPFSPRYFTAPRSLLRVLYLLVFSGLVFIPNAASRMRNVSHVHVVYMCKYMYIFARIHMRKVNACGPFWRLCERRHACGPTLSISLSLSFFLFLYLSCPSSTRDFSTLDRER